MCRLGIGLGLELELGLVLLLQHITVYTDLVDTYGDFSCTPQITYTASDRNSIMSLTAHLRRGDVVKYRRRHCHHWRTAI